MLVDFKKALADLRASRTPEENERIDTYMRLEKENTFYETTTMLDDDYMLFKYSKPRKQVNQEVKLYAYVSRDLVVSNELKLNFGGHRQYYFDKRFLERTLADILFDKTRRFCIDAGNEIYVKNSEVVRILTEATNALESKGLLARFGFI